jgi:hypothetical protein
VFALFGSLLGLIHPDVGFPARVKECYVSPLEQVRTCFRARCDILLVELILALTHCSASQSVCGATMEWTQENTSSFTELYEKMSVLWEPNHPKYYHKLHKYDAWEQIAKAMGTAPEECKNTTSLLACCRRVRGKMLQSCGTGKGMYVHMHACMLCCHFNKQKCDRNIPKPHYVNILRMVSFT